MFVIPYFTKPMIPTSIDWAFLPTYVFLDNRGRQLWSCTESKSEILETILPENGFVVKRWWMEGDFLFVNVDAEQMNLPNFYSFEEVTQKKEKGTEECWRRFFLFVCKRESEQHLETFWLQNLEPQFLLMLKSIALKDESFKTF